MMSSAPVRTVAPTETPVSLFEAKAHLRVDGTEEDTVIAAMIEAAVNTLDGWTGTLGRCIMEQTWRQDYDGFSGDMELPFPDVQSVTVAYTDATGATQTLSSTQYHLVNTIGGARLVLAYGAAWPSTYAQPDAVRITVVCGFTDLPAALKVAILLHIGALFENRASYSDKTLTPFAYTALVTPFRVVGL